MLPLPNLGGKIEYFLICSLVGTTEGFHGAGRSKMLFGEQYLPGIGCGLLAGSGRSVCVLEASGHLLPWCLSSRVRRHAAKSPGSVLVLAQRAVRAGRRCPGGPAVPAAGWVCSRLRSSLCSSATTMTVRRYSTAAAAPAPPGTRPPRAGKSPADCFSSSSPSKMKLFQEHVRRCR